MNEAKTMAKKAKADSAKHSTTSLMAPVARLIGVAKTTLDSAITAGYVDTEHLGCGSRVVVINSQKSGPSHQVTKSPSHQVTKETRAEAEAEEKIGDMIGRFASLPIVRSVLVRIFRPEDQKIEVDPLPDQDLVDAA